MSFAQMELAPMSQEDRPLYRRILLKLSGEALMGSESYGIDKVVLRAIAEQICEVHNLELRLPSSSGAETFFEEYRRHPTAWTGRPPITWACSRP